VTVPPLIASPFWRWFHAASAGTNVGLGAYEFTHHGDYYDRARFVELTTTFANTPRFWGSSGLKDWIYQQTGKEVRLVEGLERDLMEKALPYARRIDELTGKAQGFYKRAEDGIQDGYAKVKGDAEQLLKDYKVNERYGEVKEGAAKLEQRYGEVKEGAAKLHEEFKALREEYSAANLKEDFTAFREEMKQYANVFQQKSDQVADSWLGRQLGLKQDVNQLEADSLKMMRMENPEGFAHGYHKYDDGLNNPIEKLYSRLTDEGGIPQPKVPEMSARLEENPWWPNEAELAQFEDRTHLVALRRSYAKGGQLDDLAGTTVHVKIEHDAEGRRVETELRETQHERFMTVRRDGEVISSGKETFGDHWVPRQREFSEQGRTISEKFDEQGLPRERTVSDAETAVSEKFDWNEHGLCRTETTKLDKVTGLESKTSSELTHYSETTEQVIRDYTRTTEEQFVGGGDFPRTVTRTIKEDIREIADHSGVVTERSMFRHVETKEPGLLWGKTDVHPPYEARLKETFDDQGNMVSRMLADKEGYIGERIRYGENGQFIERTREVRGLAANDTVYTATRDLKGVSSYQINGVEKLKNPVLFQPPEDKHAYLEALKKRVELPAENAGVGGVGGVGKAEAAAGQAQAAKAEGAGMAGAAEQAAKAEGAGKAGAAEQAAKAEGADKAGAAEQAAKAEGKGLGGAGGGNAGAAEQAQKAEADLAAQKAARKAEQAKIGEALEKAGFEKARAETLAKQAMQAEEGTDIAGKLQSMLDQKKPLREIDPNRYKNKALQKDQALYILQCGENIGLVLLFMMGEGEPDKGESLQGAKDEFKTAKANLTAARADPAQWVGDGMEAYNEATDSLIKVAVEAGVDSSTWGQGNAVLSKLQSEISDQASTVAWDRMWVSNWLMAMLAAEPICRLIAKAPWGGQSASNTLQGFLVSSALYAWTKTISELTNSAQAHANSISSYTNELRMLARQLST